MRKIVWSRRPDYAFEFWQAQFEANVTEHAEALGLSPEAVAEIVRDGAEFEEAMREMKLARAAYEAAVQRKDKARQQCIATDRRYVAQTQANPTIDRTLFYSLDIPERNQSGPRGSAVAPADLIAKENADGSVVLKFSRGPNSESTVFSIQASWDLGETWQTVFSSTRTRVKLSGYTPGQTVYFRVVATRNGTMSAPCSPVMIWPRQLQLAAA